MKTLNYLLVLPVVLFFACSGHSVKEKINTVGDAAGQTAGEFIKGVGDGMDKAFSVNVTAPPAFAEKGLTFGKNNVSSTKDGTDNILFLYVIFHKDFSGKLTAKVFDTKNQEAGRTTATVEGKADEAKFVRFAFDENTNINSDYKITIE